ncbi:TPA: hypothetical protein ACH3X3_003307 [Trebouxia sp. C0006]
MINEQNAREWTSQSLIPDQSKLLKGDMETDLYSTAIAQENIMQGEEEEGLAPSGGLLVADADPQLTPGKIQQVGGALNLIPLYIQRKVELEVFNALIEGLPATRSSVEQLAARFAIPGLVIKLAANFHGC